MHASVILSLVIFTSVFRRKMSCMVICYTYSTLNKVSMSMSIVLYI